MSSVVEHQIPAGEIKSFGPFGAKYQVCQPIRRLDDGDWIVDVVLIETGEHAEYRLSHLMDDPGVA